MWTVVDNAVTPLAGALNARPRPVENDCGQMCTNAKRGAAAGVRRDATREPKNGTISGSFGVKKAAPILTHA
jgi:hypothetical protein